MRVLFIPTRGTPLLRSAASGEPLPSGAELACDLFEKVPNAARPAHIGSRFICSETTGHMQPSHWVAMARAVHDALSTDRYQSVVFVHGTDTMSYSASALGLMLGPLPRP